MSKRLEYTPNSKIVNHLRKMFLQSRERAKTLKNDNYTCQKCGKKQSRAKGKEVYVQVHHKKKIIWKDIIKYIRETLLVDPKYMETLCVDCHDKEHKDEK